ncbi:four helix bundle protein [Pontixanthobacter gangjinensis]|uniref:Four helix bundle protein n=1 Tax=Christiangramia aestuarii TaxID=1028746 RepID=A0A7K1LQX3_9FLAO|nr:four helix bundle protein [Christiangramia aestuarii]MUP43209.1 four helix bundle protein [Christiangramia aestuarii]
MSKFSSFEEIKAWQQARELNSEIYTLSDKGLFKADFDLKSQIRRSSISITSNIAEGFERGTTKEFIRFLYVAKGSAGEFRSQLYLAQDLKYITSEDFERLSARVNEISKMISGLIKYLDTTL